MKHDSHTRRRAAGTILFLLLLTLFACARAAKAPVLFVSPDGEYGPRAIRLMAVERKGTYLFLPGSVNLSEWKIGWTGAERVTLNGADLGEKPAADLLLDQNEVSFDGKKATAFDVLRGSPGLPALYITTETGKLDKIHSPRKIKEPGYLCMTDGDGNTLYDGKLAHMKLRGNSSATYPKKNYQLKLETGTDLLGFGKAKRWILTGSWLDRTFIRNQLTYDLAYYIGCPFTPQHQQVEVYVNHEYLGLFLFSEKVEINEGRIEIRNLEKETEKLNDKALSEYKRAKSRKTGRSSWKAWNIPNDPEDLTGGYLIEYEKQKGRYKPEPSGFTTRRNVFVILKSPEYATKAQMLYISAFMQGFENAIHAGDGLDPDTGKHWSEFVDRDSLVLKYMVNEFSQNYDGNISSEFFYKPPDTVSKVAIAGPVWDMDNTYAAYARNYNKDQISSPRGLFIAGAGENRYWWPNLYKHDDFRLRLRELYEERFRTAVKILFGQAEDPEGRLRSLDAYTEEIAASAEMNFVRYPFMKNPWSDIDTGATFADNIAYLRDFMQQRAAWLETAWLEGE